MSHILTLIGVDITCRMINSITSSAKTVYSVINTIRDDGTHIEITDYLRDIDIEITIRTIETLIKELDINQHNSESINLCLSNLNDIVSEFHKELADIHEKITYNNSLWVLKRVRKWDFIENMKRIDKMNDTLHNRWKLLRDVLSIKEAMKKADDMQNIDGENMENEYANIPTEESQYI